jgi:hypothetical protein
VSKERRPGLSGARSSGVHGFQIFAARERRMAASWVASGIACGGDDEPVGRIAVKRCRQRVEGEDHLDTERQHGDHALIEIDFNFARCIGP